MGSVGSDVEETWQAIAAARDERAGAFSEAEAWASGHIARIYLARPGYSRKAVQWAFAQLPSGITDIVDVGAGAGQLTDAILGLDSTVSLRAVDPSEAMRAEFQRLHPAIPALNGAWEELPLADESVDVIAGGTSIHFGGTSTGQEIYRVLRPRGAVMLFANRIHGWLGEALSGFPRQAGNVSPITKDLDSTGFNLGSRFETGDLARFEDPVQLSQADFLKFLRTISLFYSAPAENAKIVLSDTIRASREHTVTGKIQLPQTTAVQVLHAKKAATKR